MKSWSRKPFEPAKTSCLYEIHILHPLQYSVNRLPSSVGRTGWGASTTTSSWDYHPPMLGRKRSLSDAPKPRSRRVKRIVGWVDFLMLHRFPNKTQAIWMNTVCISCIFLSKPLRGRASGGSGAALWQLGLRKHRGELGGWAERRDGRNGRRISGAFEVAGATEARRG